MLSQPRAADLMLLKVLADLRSTGATVTLSTDESEAGRILRTATVAWETHNHQPQANLPSGNRLDWSEWEGK